MPDPSKTLREIAEMITHEELRQKVQILAAQFELQHNQQNNAFQGVIGNAELSFANQFDTICAEIEALRVGQGHADEHQHTIEAMLAAIRADLALDEAQ